MIFDIELEEQIEEYVQRYLKDALENGIEEYFANNDELLELVLNKVNQIIKGGVEFEIKELMEKHATEIMAQIKCASSNDAMSNQLNILKRNQDALYHKIQALKGV